MSPPLHFALLFIFFLLPLYSCGTFTHSTTVSAIQQSIANRNEYSDYTFNLIPDTQIPVGGTLEVTFPSQYTQGLGISINPNSNSYCSMPCSVNQYIVKFSIQTVCLPGVMSSFTVYSVLNPSSKGGTGSFIIRSKQGVNILDENLVFGVVGIADSVNNLTSSAVALDTSGSSEAGVLTKYSFSFITSQLIPQTSYFMITIPSTAGFSISKNPSCSSFSINGNQISGNLVCSSEGNNIIATGLSSDIPVAFEVGISVSLTNPTFSGTTDTFQVAILKINTTIIYAWSTGIKGVTITPGALSKVTLSLLNPALVLAMTKVMDFRLIFIPKNSLISGSEISIVFPVASVSNCYIEFGLDDSDPTNPTTCSPSGSDTLVISGFKPMSNSGEISLTMRMTTPSLSGLTTAVQIYTYFYMNSAQTIIDQDVTSASLMIMNIQSTNTSPLTVTITSGTGTNADGTAANFDFSINPSITVAAKTYIRVVVPTSFNVNTITTADCLFTGLGVPVTSLFCSNVDQVIMMQLPTGITYNIGTQGTFQITNNKISKPTAAGSYLFDITTMASDAATPIESYSLEADITPDSLTSMTSTFIGQETAKLGTLQLDFVPNTIIPAGVAQTTETDIRGVIQLVFNGISPDLGTGITADNTQIPCTATHGILPLTNMVVSCYLYPSIGAVEITNFQSIPAQTICQIFIPKIVVQAGNIDLNIIKRYNRVDLILNTINGGYIASAPNTITMGSLSKTFTFTASAVSTIFDFSFNMDLSQSVTATDYLLVELPTYDVGYLQDKSMVTCFLYQAGNAATPTPTAYECIKFAIIDWILIKVTDAFPSSSTTTLYLRNLKWPRYTKVTGIPVYIVHYSAMIEVEVNQYQTFDVYDVPVSNDFLSASMSVPKKGKGYPDCDYYFKFKALNAIPDGGSVVLTFPSIYSIQSSFPSPQFQANQFSGYGGNSLVFTPSANVLTISNIASFPAKSLFTITVRGIKNPITSDTTSTGWTIQTNYNGYPINIRSNFDFFQYGSSYSPGNIIFNSVTAFPQNANVLADYTIEFTPYTSIPALGLISITFPPAQFNSMPANPSCSISGGLVTFSSCTLSGTTIIIITDEVYTTGSLIVTIKDITNPEAGLTDGFEIYTFYDNNFLDITDDTDNSYRTVLVLPQANPITVNSIDFEPKNEGESATYTFVFIPTSPITTSMEIMIQFPDNYDDLLGVLVQSSGTSGIIGDFTVSIDEKRLYLKGLEAYTPSNDNPLTIQVYNVINPNRISSLGFFRIATFQQNTEVFIDYNEDITGLEMVAAAGWLSIYNISADNYYARLYANYTLNFTLSEQLPNVASQGYIIVDFPSQFDIPDKNINCSSPQSLFSDVQCYITKNKVYAYGNPDAYSGTLQVTFNLVDNPPLSGSTSEITIMTYDGFNKYIIERSYPNLDPFSYKYSYNGPLILVNNDQTIIVERGTQSSDITLALQYPCALNLSFSSTVTTISLFPSVLYLNLGDLVTTFRVTVPVSLPEGTYYIVWETFGDQIPPIYTPLKKTTVTVTNLKNVPITLSDISNIPYGGSSLSIFAVLTYSPNIGIELIASLDADYPGVSLSTKNIIFSPGDTVKSFEILYSNDSSITNNTLISKGSVSLILSGVNKDTYTLSSSDLGFVVIAADVQAPTLTQLVTVTIGQTYCQISIGANEIVMAYYMIALTGTANPTYDEVVNQGPILYSNMQKQYGAAFIGSSNLITITVNNLYAQTPYTIYVYLENRGLNVNKIKTLSFVTSNRFPASQFSLQFLQAYLNNAEKQSIINSVAFVLSMPPSHIYVQNYTFTRRELECSPNNTNFNGIVLNEGINVDGDIQNRIEEDGVQREISRNIQSSGTVSTILALWMFSVSNNPNYPSPYGMARLLLNETEQLSSLLTNFDSSYVIPVSNFTSYTPSFVEPPTVPVVDQFYVTVKGKLNNYGFIYAIALNASQDQSKPSSFQIYKGFDSGNLPIQSGKVEASSAFTYFSFDITNLSANTQYNVYITAGSVHPGYPDLMADTSVVLVAVLTKPLIIYDPLNINASIRGIVCRSLAIVAVMVLLWLGE